MEVAGLSEMSVPLVKPAKEFSQEVGTRAAGKGGPVSPTQHPKPPLCYHLPNA
jgi:hypothetical protein